MEGSRISSEKLKSKFGQVVLVFQGGGALGAYQAGVYEALHEKGVEPDWVIGTSIGAINAFDYRRQQAGRPTREAARVLAPRRTCADA